MSHKPLPIRPLAYDDETAASLLIRASYLNGYCSSQQLIRHIDSRIKVSHVVNNRAKFSHIASELGISIETTDNIIPFRTGPTKYSKRIFRHHKIPASAFRDDGSALCPECLQEKEYLRQDWLLKPYYACIKHSILLIDHCPNCETSITSARGKISFCDKCNHDFRKVTKIGVNTSDINWLLDSISESNQEYIRRIFLFWDAHSKTFQNQSIQSEANRLKACMHFMHNSPEAKNAIIGTITTQSQPPHPRVFLLPFLKSEDLGVVNFAEEAISEIPQKLYINSRNNSRVKLNITDTCIVLKINQSNLHECLRGTDLETLLLNKKSSRIVFFPTSEVLGLLHEKRTEITAGLNENTISPEWLSIEQAAQYLRTHETAVRSVIKSSQIKTRITKIKRTTATQISRRSLCVFHENFACIGTLAKELNVPPNNLRDKLASLNILPAFPLYIKGMKTPIYRRAETQDLNEEKIKSIKKYQTKSGRPKSGSAKLAPYTSRSVLLKDVAQELKISRHRALTLVHEKILDISDEPYHKILVTRSSLDSLKENISKDDYISLTEAATMIGISPQNLILNYYNTGIIEIKDLHLWRLISLKDVQKVISMRKNYITASEAGFLLGSHRSLMTNLEKAGKIKSELYQKKRKIKLYEMTDFNELLDKLNQL
ncbi:TniQ family protein [Pseudomonas aeruginosa]|uniref:TniQ family protein n=1 Tax=Pseudomonas aeruginosa TaxID=287 RepID=UPI002A6B37DB|nr:TniQ family protein [Pseudomonas aeruginosa]MDY1338837.1 TniQ family protein [Pseudomonas aeruginosa]